MGHPEARGGAVKRATTVVLSSLEIVANRSGHKTSATAGRT